MIEGVDFSFARPGGAALVAADKSFVVRYVPYAGDGGKGLTKAEIADYRAHGLAICLVFESLAGRALTAGLPGGAADARTSQTALVNLGMPRDLPIYFAVDRDVDATHQPAIDAYLRGAAGVLGNARVGVYGEASLMKRCRANGTAAWFWQTYAWSYQVVAPGIHLYQYKNSQVINGGAVDFTRAMQAEYGQWSAPLPDTGADMAIHLKAQNWTPTKSTTGASNGVLRTAPDRALKPSATIPLGDLVTSIGYVDPDWWVTRLNGVTYFMLVSVDWTAVPDADLDRKFDEFLSRLPCLSQAELDAAALAARANGYTAGRADGTNDEKARVRSLLGL